MTTRKTRWRSDYAPPSAQSIAATKSKAKRQGNNNLRNNSPEATAQRGTPPLFRNQRNRCARRHLPSRRRPGTEPIGLTETPRSRNPKTRDNANFYFNRRRAKALIVLKAQRRRAWRYYKRTRFRDRARQVAKVVLRESSLSKREACTRNTKQKIWKKSKKWFQKNLVNHNVKFQHSSQRFDQTSFLDRQGIYRIIRNLPNIFILLQISRSELPRWMFGD